MARLLLVLSPASQVTVLDLSTNEIAGELPAEIGQLAAINKLYFTGCKLSGSIPHEIGQLKSLQELHLGNNLLQGVCVCIYVCVYIYMCVCVCVCVYMCVYMCVARAVRPFILADVLCLHVRLCPQEPSLTPSDSSTS